MNTNEITALAEKIVNDGFNGIYVPKIKSWTEWNYELAAWVIIREDRINEKLNDILTVGYQAAIKDGSMELVQAAMDLFKPSMKARLVKAIRTLASRNPEFLQGDFPPATVAEAVTDVEEIAQIEKAEEEGLPVLENNDNAQDDRF